MKVLHVISSGGMYGAEAVILALCNEFARKGHQCEIATFDNKHLPNRQLLEAAEARGIRVHSIPCRGQVDRRTLQELRTIVSTGKYDVCHSHGFKSDVYLYGAARQLEQCIVATCHTWYDNDVRLTLYGMLDRWVLRCFRHVVSVSIDVTRQLVSAGVSGKKITFIRNGVDIGRFRGRKRALRKELGIADEQILVGTVGRLSPEKGLDYLIRAAQLVAREAANVRFAIIGDGPERENLERLAAELRVADVVDFLGRRTDTPEVFASLDILVQPSLNEGLPITILEALASGCAIVASSVGTVPEVIETGISGVLVLPKDVEELARAISTVALDSQLRSSLSRAALARAEEFSSERMAQAYFDVYVTALGRGSATSGAGA